MSVKTYRLYDDQWSTVVSLNDLHKKLLDYVTAFDLSEEQDKAIKVLNSTDKPTTFAQAAVLLKQVNKAFRNTSSGLVLSEENY